MTQSEVSFGSIEGIRFRTTRTAFGHCYEVECPDCGQFLNAWPHEIVELLARHRRGCGQTDDLPATPLELAASKLPAWAYEESGRATYVRPQSGKRYFIRCRRP